MNSLVVPEHNLAGILISDGSSQPIVHVFASNVFKKYLDSHNSTCKSWSFVTQMDEGGREVCSVVNDLTAGLKASPSIKGSRATEVRGYPM